MKSSILSHLAKRSTAGFPLPRAIVAIVAISMIAAGCSTTVVADAVAAPATGGSWDPQTLPAIPVATTGSGAPVASYENSVVTPAQGLAVSLRPSLQVAGAPAKGQYQFSISTIGGIQDQTIWRTQAATNEVKVASGVLRQGETYLWQAVAVSSGKTYGPYAMQVDANRAGFQPTQAFGPVGVDLASGSVSYSAPLRTVRSASGALGVDLNYKAGQDARPGLPAGWSMQGSQQGWSHLQTYPNGSVAMVSASGAVSAFSPTTDGSAYVPIAAAGRAAPTGQTPTLTKNVDNTWTATMPSGQVSVFGQADGSGLAYLTHTYNGMSAKPTYELSDGRLVRATDSVSTDTAVDIHYAGSGACPKPPSGFVDTPKGMLCSITYPDESSTSFFYLTDAANNPLLARIVDYPDTQDSKASVTDIGYDQAPRIVSIRQPLAASAQASGARSDAAQLLTTVSYDASGRAQTITKPAATAGAVTPAYTISYSPNQGQATVTNAGPKTRTGYSAKYTYDTKTLLPLSTTDSRGLTTKQTWNSSADLLLTSIDQAGRTTQRTYDGNNNPTSIVGPMAGSKPTASTPQETYSYDQDLSGAQPKDMHGFNVTYWANATLTGSPSGRGFGPILNGTSPPASTAWSWTSSPTGSDEPWSARLTGLVTTTAAASKGNNPVYGFSVSPDSNLWIDNVACTASQSPGQCAVPLAPGEHQIRVDLKATQPGSAGQASVAVNWRPPGASGFAPIPMTSIAPGYGLRSVTTKNDALSSSSSDETKLMSDFANPSTGKQTAAWMQLSPQIKGTASYEPFNPDNGEFGRPASSKLPAGNEIINAYYEPNETVSVPCDGMGRINQHGLARSTTRSTTTGDTAGDGRQTYTNYYDLMGRLVSADINGDSASCSYYNDAGDVVRQVVPARGDQPEASTTILSLVDGNPMKTSAVTTVGKTTYHRSAETDLYGRPVTATDIWGTTQTFTYDPYTGNTLSEITTPPNGRKSTLASTYSADGDLQTVSLDGKTLATVGTPTSVAGTVRYGNGVVQQVSTDSIGGFGSQTWTTSDHKKFGYSVTKSPMQRILSEYYQFASGKPNATFQYSYDVNGRLANAELATKLPVAHTSWQYEFGTTARGSNPAAGLNGNRTKQVVDKQHVTEYGYNMHDQITETTDPTTGSNIEYSSWGEITHLGSLTFDYDAGGMASRIVDSQSRQTVSYTRLGGDLVEKTTTSPGKPSSVSRYSSGGFILDSNNKPQWRSIGLPGGATLLQNVAGAQSWQHQSARGQLMWTSNQNGQDTGQRNLYSPFGEELIAGGSGTTPPSTPTPPVNQSQTSASPVSPKPAATTPASPAPAATTPASPKPAATTPTSPAPAATTSPAPVDPTPVTPGPNPSPTSSNTADVPAPNYQWQAGNGLESQQIGSSTVIDMGARLYVPSLGRFTSPDPVDQGSINAYDYANQDPINQSDPTGTMSAGLKIFLSVLVTVVSAALSFALPQLLGVVGIAADAITVARQAAYIAINMASAGILSLATTEVDLKINGEKHMPWYDYLKDSLLTILDVTVAGYMARAAMIAASTTRLLTNGATAAANAAAQGIKDAAVITADAIRVGQQATADAISAGVERVSAAATQAGIAAPGVLAGAAYGYYAVVGVTGDGVMGAFGAAAGAAVGGGLAHATVAAARWARSAWGSFGWLDADLHLAF